jgi:hypothetical protein
LRQEAWQIVSEIEAEQPLGILFQMSDGTIYTAVNPEPK